MQFDDKIRWMSYTMVDKRVTAIGSGLVQWAQLQFGDKIGMYMDTRREWMQTALACFQHGFIVATCYANLGEDALVHVINECALSTIVTDHKLLPILESIAAQCPSLKKVIYVGVQKTDFVSQHYSLISLGGLACVGLEKRVRPVRAPERTSTAVIMYTSGSTGRPKGVVVPHKAIVGGSGAWSTVLHLTTQDCWMGYLPLAHILELVAEICMLTHGVRIAYGTPKTLTSKFAQPCGDLEALNPTIFPGVPRVHESVRKGIINKVNASGGIKKKLFERAFRSKSAALKNGQSSLFWDSLVFNKIKAKAGLSNLRVVVSGGAPLSKETMEFVRTVFGVSVVQGYGLTETCGGGCIQDPTQFSTGNVGYPIRSCEIRLVDVPELGYFTPQAGEICIRGNNVADGYFNLPEQTAEVFKNGWFHTGDVGSWNQDGTLRIIDRKKSLIKLAHGEYVGLESLEMIFNNSRFVSPNGICIHADSFQDYIVAIIQPQVNEIEAWARENGVTEDSNESLIQNPDLKRAVIADLKQIAMEHGKKKFEMVGNLHLIESEFSPETGELTAAMKLQRHNIVKKYAQEIETMYAEGSLV